MNEEEKIIVTLHDINYIPGYKEAEEKRRSQESERQTSESIRESNEMTRENYYENFKRRVDNGEFHGGSPNILSIGSVEKGDTASAEITGESPHQILNLVLPKGDKGESNYNNLDNTPIKRLNGTMEDPIVFRSLNVGIYLITGFCCYNEPYKQSWSFIDEFQGVTEEVLVIILLKNSEKSRAVIFGNGYSDLALCRVTDFTDEQAIATNTIQ